MLWLQTRKGNFCISVFSVSFFMVQKNGFWSLKGAMYWNLIAFFMLQMMFQCSFERRVARKKSWQQTQSCKKKVERLEKKEMHKTACSTKKSLFILHHSLSHSHSPMQTLQSHCVSLWKCISTWYKSVSIHKPLVSNYWLWPQSWVHMDNNCWLGWLNLYHFLWWFCFRTANMVQNGSLYRNHL